MHVYSIEHVYKSYLGNNEYFFLPSEKKLLYLSNI